MTDRTTGSDDTRRGDLRSGFKRDLTRFTRRERGNASFWEALSVIGTVGWPIVLATAGGALAGRWLHERWNTGIGLTVLLVVIGAVVGMTIMWRVIQPRQR